MREFKPGDVMWIRSKPFSIDDDGDAWLTDGEGSVEIVQGPCLPDHPALPKVSAWLAETPDAPTKVRKALAHLTTYGFLPDDEQEAMVGLVEALTPEAGDAVPQP